MLVYYCITDVFDESFYIQDKRKGGGIVTRQELVINFEDINYMNRENTLFLCPKQPRSNKYRNELVILTNNMGAFYINSPTKKMDKVIRNFSCYLAKKKGH